jgi:hypothetical protein
LDWLDIAHNAGPTRFVVALNRPLNCLSLNGQPSAAGLSRYCGKPRNDWWQGEYESLGCRRWITMTPSPFKTSGVKQTAEMQNHARWSEGSLWGVIDIPPPAWVWMICWIWIQAFVYSQFQIRKSRIAEEAFLNCQVCYARKVQGKLNEISYSKLIVFNMIDLHEYVENSWLIPSKPICAFASK